MSNQHNNQFNTDEFISKLKRQENLFRSIGEIELPEKLLKNLEPFVNLSNVLSEKVGENYAVHIVCVPKDESFKELEITIQTTFRDSVLFKSPVLFYRQEDDACYRWEKKVKPNDEKLNDEDLSNFFNAVSESVHSSIIEKRRDVLEKIYSYDVIHNKIKELNTNKLLEQEQSTAQSVITNKTKKRI